MKQSFSKLAATVACLAAAAEAGRSPFKGRDIDGKWRSPRETTSAKFTDDIAYMPQLQFHATNVAAEAPATTAPATLQDRRFLKRDSSDNTCAYVSGDSDSSLYCDATAECVVNTHLSFVGCCADTASSCSVYTTCLASSEESQYTTDNGLTLWCGGSTYTECATYYYIDSVFSGYSLLGCAMTQEVNDVYYQATDGTTTTSSSKRTTSTSTKTTSTSTPATTPTTTTAPHTTTTKPSTATTAPPATSTAAAAKKTNVGAIAGGVVGGVAGLALIALGAFFLIRRSNKNHVNNVTGGAAGGVAAGAPGGPPGGGQPPMGQVPQPPYYGSPGQGDAAALAAAGAGAGGAIAYQQHQQQQYPPQPYQQDAKLYDPYNQQGQQLQQGQQQQYDPRGSVYTAAPTMTSPGASPPPVQSPQFGSPQFSGAEGAAVNNVSNPASPNAAVSPYTPPPPAPGMGFHSGPVPSTLDVAELPTERGHGELRELA